MATVKNTCPGPRGVYVEGNLVMVEPGQIIEADDFEPEWFEEVESEDGLAAMKVADLKALAEAEGIDLGDASKKADIISAIELAREASAKE